MLRGWRSGKPRAADTGVTVLELAIVLGCLTLLAGGSIPSVTRAVDAGRARHAAGMLASRLRQARQDAVLGSRSVGVVFDPDGKGGWTFRVCADGNANGIRRADIVSGTDACQVPAIGLADAVPGTEFGVPPDVAGPEGSAPGSDPVRFGASDIASFSPGGTCTGGTAYIRSSGGVQFAVRVAGATGRTRVLRYAPELRQWIPG